LRFIAKCCFANLKRELIEWSNFYIQGFCYPLFIGLLGYLRWCIIPVAGDPTSTGGKAGLLLIIQVMQTGYRVQNAGCLNTPLFHSE
jgi:hypothetical protein